ncbi:MAG: MarR family transcriptional regulator [Solirubrobacteraceae bacterium]
MLDQIRRDIQSRLDELLGEVDKLRRALAALTSRDGTDASADGTPPAARPPSADESTDATSSKPRSRQRAGATTRAAGASTRRAAGAAPAAVRTAPGATKAAVLAALAQETKAMTAGEIAAATGLGRATISTTLSKLAKSGEVAKADRGYRAERPATDGAADGAGDSEATPAE